MIRKFFTLLFVAFSITVNAQSLETFHDFSAIKINGDTLNFSDFAGQKVLVVNTASQCGFTPQYADLEQLYLQYGGPNFTILGFPCNDFGGQEPGNDGQIDTFCTGTYGITFQMMKKISITAIDTLEVYKWLQLQSRNGVADAPVLWNFQKFMIDEAGHWHNYALSAVNPLDTSITNWINSPSVLAVSENVSGLLSVNINPNPSDDKTSIYISSNKISDATIKMYTPGGQLAQEIFKGKLQQSNNIVLNTANLNSGIYFIKIETATGYRVAKINIVR